ncbi:MAG: hypothetical protein DHS20C02_14940 [Micavibrio sp.]|nr:MAG: hypothetical protein DHS20C02_14940 [Micavibrio sp.]
MKTHISNEFQAHRDWLVEDFFIENVLPALMMFTEQMSAVAIQQVLIIGTFLDAKHQLETQRLFQQLQAQAHKDYHPSEDFCWFGTNVRSMANSESRGRHHAVAMSQRALARHLGNANVNSSRNRDQDKGGRWRQFTSVYCDPKDNNWDSDANGTGLVLACGAAGGAEKNRRNHDVDYTRLIDEPRSFNFDFVGDFGEIKTGDEEDIIAMASNLYGNDVLTRNANKENLKNKQAQHLYLTLRSVAAKRSVAENSFNAIVGLKSFGTSDYDGNEPMTRKYMGAVLFELGVPEEEIFLILKERPSYYAQLEILAKKIYQNPDFYANLYDKPANVARKKVALQAIELMLDRAIYESQIRQEMVMSVLLSSKLRDSFRDVNKDMVGMMNVGN